MKEHMLIGLLLATVASCSPTPHRGALTPLKDEDVVLVTTHGLPNDTARLTSTGATANVTGRWSDKGETLEIQYRSTGAPVRVQMASTSTWQGHVAPASAAWDRSVEEPGNATGRPLLGAGILQMAPNEQKLVQIEYSRSMNGDGPEIGDEVSIAVPTADGPRTVRFRVSGE